MTLRSVLDVRKRGERPPAVSSVRRPPDRAGCGVAALLMGAIVALIVSPAFAQTTSLSATTTGRVLVSATTGAPWIVGNSVLTGTATFIYTDEGSTAASAR